MDLIRKILREETDAPYGGKMSDTGLLYSKLDDLRRHGLFKGDKKYDQMVIDTNEIIMEDLDASVTNQRDEERPSPNPGEQFTQ